MRWCRSNQYADEEQGHKRKELLSENHFSILLLCKLRLARHQSACVTFYSSVTVSTET